jgi:uncharacterized repeat protein (TIGR03803 family)
MKNWIRFAWAFSVGVLLAGEPEPPRFVHFGTPFGAASRPSGPLTVTADGSLYGVAREGGEFGFGAIYRVVEDGAAYQVVHSFRWEDGKGPSGKLLATADGWLVGTAVEGGVRGQGTLFRFRPNGSRFEVLHALGSGPADAAEPVGSLVGGPGGVLWGVGGSGGLSGAGAIFRWDPDSAGFTVIHEFVQDRAEGSFPSGFLHVTSDGWLVGTANNEPQFGGGALFRGRPDGTGMATTARFGSLITTTSSYFFGSFLPLPEGALLGLATDYRSSGAHTGRVFQIQPDGSGFRILRQLDSRVGGYPQASPILGSDGWVYLATTASSNGFGAVARFDPRSPDTNAVEIVHRFVGNALQTQGLTEDPTGWIWGTTLNGRSALETGTLFRFRRTPPGTPTSLEMQLGTNYQPNLAVQAPTTREDRTNIVVTFRRMSDLDSPASLVARTVGHTAVAGLDFEPVDTVVRFPAGVGVQTLLIPLINDRLGFGERSLSLRFSDLEGPILPLPQVELRIQDDDAFSEIRVEFPDFEPFSNWPPTPVPEGIPQFRVHISRAFGWVGTNRIPVRYEVRPATQEEIGNAGGGSVRPAVPGVHFQPRSGQFEFGATVDSVEIPISIPENFVATGTTAITVTIVPEDPRFRTDLSRTLYLGDNEVGLLPIESPAEGLGLKTTDVHYLLEDGRLMVLPAVAAGEPAQFLVLRTNGLPDLAWGTRGRLVAPRPRAGFAAESTFVGPDGRLWFPQRERVGGRLRWERTDRAGRLESPLEPTLRLRSLMAVFADGKVLVDSEELGLVRLRSDGTRDPGFHAPEGLQALSASVDGLGRIYLTRATADSQLVRLQHDGRLDTAYRPLGHRRGRSIESLLVAPDGSAAVRLDSDETLRLDAVDGSVADSAPAIPVLDAGTGKKVFGGIGSTEILSATPLPEGRMAVVWSVGCSGIRVDLVEADGTTRPFPIPALHSFQQWRPSRRWTAMGQASAVPLAKNGWGGGGWSFECEGGPSAVVGLHGIWIHEETTLTYTPFAELPGRFQFVESLAVRTGSQAALSLVRVGPTFGSVVGRVHVHPLDRHGEVGTALAAVPVRFAEGQAETTVDLTVADGGQPIGPRWFRLRFVPETASASAMGAESDLLFLDADRRNGSLDLVPLPDHLGDGVLTALTGKDAQYLVQQGPEPGFESSEATSSTWIWVGIEDRIAYRLHRPPDGRSLFFRVFSE